MSDLPARPEDLALAHRRGLVARNLRRSVRGVVLAGLVAGVVLSGALPLTSQAASALLFLAGVLAVTRILRGLWTVRVARHLFGGWSARHGLRGPVRILPSGQATFRHAELQAAAPPAKAERDSPDRKAVRLLTEGGEEELVTRARERGLALVDRMEELKLLLADSDLSSILRRPLAEERARVETDLEALLLALTELSRSAASQRDDLLQRLAARLEVERSVPAGLLAVT